MEKITRMFIPITMATLVILYSGLGFTQADQETYQRVVFIQAIEARMKVMERHYNMKFDPAWAVREKLIFGIPENIDAGRRKNFGGLYHPESQNLFFKPDYLDERIELDQFHKDVLASGELRDKLRELFDHELGHVLVDHLARRIGKGAWPDTLRFQKMKWRARMGINITSEGIGTFFENTSVFEDSKISAELLPETLKDPRWQDKESLKKIYYEGGHWLVRPIIKQFGERGIAYLITRPFVVEDNARQAAQKYQNKAIEKLSSSD